MGWGGERQALAHHTVTHTAHCPSPLDPSLPQSSLRSSSSWNQLLALLCLKLLEGFYLTQEKSQLPDADEVLCDPIQLPKALS